MSEESFVVNGDVHEFGDWQIELRSDEFANIKHKGHSVLRSIRCVIRDHDWNTADLVIDRQFITNDSVVFQVHSEGFGSSYVGELVAKFINEEVRFTIHLTSENDFSTNRTGLIVLHEPELAGTTLEVIHSDGQLEKTVFPIEISPNQPVLDINCLSWPVDDGQIAMEFNGDIFEMEDQRNWTDASFKTYSRPLDRPFPYALKKGEVVWQEIIIRSAMKVDVQLPQERLKIELSDSGWGPAVQVGAATAPGSRPSYKEFAHAELVELDLGSANWKAALDRSMLSGVPLDVRLIGDFSEALNELVEMLDEAKVIRIALYDSNLHVSTIKTTHDLKEALQAANKNIPIISGARSHFTELNRQQNQISPNADGVCFASTPLFHSLTTAQLLEAVAMQRLTANQGVKIAKGKPVHIGPITLRPRFNNVATAKQPEPKRSDLSEGYGAEFTGSKDSRQISQELGTWVIASASAFSVRGVDSITWFEAWGPRGIRDFNGQDFPVAKALSALSYFHGLPIKTGCDLAGEVWVICAELEDKHVALCANLRQSEVAFDLELPELKHQVKLAPLEWQRIEF